MALSVSNARLVGDDDEVHWMSDSHTYDEITEHGGSVWPEEIVVLHKPVDELNFWSFLS